MSPVTVLVAPDGHVQAAGSSPGRVQRIGLLLDAITASGLAGWAVTEMDAAAALGRLAEDCAVCRMPCGCSADDKLARQCPHRLGAAH